MRPTVLPVILGVLLLFAADGCDDEPEEAVPADTGTPSASQASPSTSPSASDASSSATVAPSPGPGETLWRWANVTVVVPNDSGIFVGPDFAAQGVDQIVPLRIEKLDSQDTLVSSLVLIDAKTGDVVERSVLAEHEAEMDEVLGTVTVSEFDVNIAGWPYRDTLPTDVVRQTEAPFSFLRPSPESGLYVGFGVADPGGPFIDIRNERSVAGALIRDGSLQPETSFVVEADLPVFERWLAEVKLCGVEVEC